MTTLGTELPYCPDFKDFFLIYSFICLPALGLSCSTQDLQWWHMNSQLWHVRPSSLTRDQTHSPALGWWCLSHWTTREVPVQIVQIDAEWVYEETFGSF